MRLGLILFAATALAAVDGRVTNKTTGKPQAGVMVALVDLRQGMAPVASASTGAEGKFRIDKDLPGPQLLQATYEGVGYNKVIQPGAPTTGLELEVYSSSSKPGTAKVSQDMVLVEPGESEILVDEAFLFQNGGNQTYSDPANGTLRFYLPPETKGKARVSVTSQGIPVQRQAEKTSLANIYKVSYPIRPGETRFDIAYSLPKSAKLTGKTLHGGPVRLIAPTGVTLEGGNLEALGTEPATQATIYGVKGASYAIEVKGTGSLRASQSAPAGGDSASEDGPTVQQIKPRIYDRLVPVLALGLGILALAFVVLYTRRPAEAAAVSTAVPKDKRK